MKKRRFLPAVTGQVQRAGILRFCFADMETAGPGSLQYAVRVAYDYLQSGTRVSGWLLQQLSEEDRKIIFSIIDKMLTNKKFKDFFQKNVAAL